MKKICLAVVVVALLGSLAAAFAADADGPPLPTVETVLQRLAEQSQKEEANDLEFKQRYHFTRSRATEVRNANGELNKREVKTQVNKPMTNLEKLDVTAETQIKRRGKTGRKTDFTVDREFLQRFQFTLVGRETINGRPTLILDFIPATAKPPERDLNERVINRMAGRVWVDEGESVLAKADFHLTEKVNVVAGLVGAVVSFTLSFDRARTADGLWFTPRLDWQLDAREVFVRRTVESHEEITNVGLER